MDSLSLIKRPIELEFSTFVELFTRAMTHEDGLLGNVLAHIRQRGGKRMRPILTLLMAKNFGEVSDVTQNAAIGLELLHTASLVHDDVVDESAERRGQASVNATFNNKVAVLVGDYILSTALFHVSKTGNRRIVENLSQLGRTLAAGEILQLSNVQNPDFSEQVYYDVIHKKTASLFESCAVLGCLSVGAPDAEIERARQFGETLGMMFQIRDDIFDYYDSREIGKPTGNDMAEGKLTLPVLYALKTTPMQSMITLAKKVKAGTINTDEIAVLVDYTKQAGGIEYAEQRMQDFYDQSMVFIDESVKKVEIRDALVTYLDYVMKRHY
ncbi:MAG: polyprenyl synthetase family protein [Prevotella sp.]|jgi:octaprenyl-diphosphate synthase|nr:polyprenyl synthetase family protein [Prevotella sp.]